MDIIMNIIMKFCPGITSIGPWLSRKGIVYAIILGGLFAFFLMSVGAIPTPPDDPKATTYPLWQALYFIVFPVIFVFLWFVTTQAYLRSGQGTKIGLAYDGHAVNICDWKRTKK